MFELHPLLSRYNDDAYCASDLALTIAAFGLLVEVTLLIMPVFIFFFQKVSKTFAV